MKDPYVSLKHVPEEERESGIEYKKVYPMTGCFDSIIPSENIAPAKWVKMEDYKKCFETNEPSLKPVVKIENYEIVRYHQESIAPFMSDRKSTFVCGKCRHSWKGEKDLPTSTCPNCKLTVIHR